MLHNLLSHLIQKFGLEMQHAKKAKEKERMEEEGVGVTLQGVGLPAWWHSAPDAESPRPAASFQLPSAACCCSGWGRDRGMCGGTEDGGKGGTVTTRWLS